MKKNSLFNLDFCRHYKLRIFFIYIASWKQIISLYCILFDDVWMVLYCLEWFIMAGRPRGVWQSGVIVMNDVGNEEEEEALSNVWQPNISTFPVPYAE